MGGRCWGECDGDKQCAYGLKCFERSKGEPIPGCKDGKKKVPAHYDYCYDPKIDVKKPPTIKCGAGSATNCKVSTISTPKYSTGNILRVDNGKKVKKSTDKHSCPAGYKIWSPRNKTDWTIVYNAMSKNINNYPKKPHLIVDVTRAANKCGGCTKYAMKSTTAQQGSWKTTDGSAWWLRDAKYNEPNGDYHANCYLHVYDVNPNNVRFNDGNCNYKSNAYLCQPAAKKKPVKTKTVVAYQEPDRVGGCPNTGRKANADLIAKKITVAEKSYVIVTGHMIRKYKGRADMYLNLNKKRIDYTLTYTPSTQWKDGQVYWVGSINKGSHTFSISGSRQGIFGCGGAWGDLDILVVPNLAGVKTYQWGIKSSCPQKGAFKKTFSATLAKDSVAWVNGHVISRGKAKRADLHLYIDGKRRDRSLSEDLNNQWVDQNVMHAINLKKGNTHSK